MEIVDEPGPDTETIEKEGATVHWRRVARRDHDGEFRFADDPQVFARLADRTDRPVAAVREEFDRKHRYVRYMVEEELDDFEALFEFLSDLKNDEAATVERVRREE